MSGGGLPSGWSEASLGDVVEPSDTRSPKREGPGTFRYVDVDALDNTRQVIANPKTVAKSEAPSRARMLIKNGDVLFCLVRPYLKNIAIVPPELDGEIASTAYSVLRPGSGIDTRFLFYQLLQESFIHAVPTYGNSPPSARDDEFLQMRVGVAPPDEQRRIVAKIEELFSDLDAGVAALTRVRANLKRYRASVLKAAVEGRLTAAWRAAHPDVEPADKLLARILAERRAKWEADQLREYAEKGKEPPKGWKTRYVAAQDPAIARPDDLPRSWAWATIEQAAAPVPRAIQSGPFGSNLLHSEFQASGVLAIGIDNVLNGRFSLGSQHRISEAKFEQLAKYEARPLDFLITVMATVGRCCTVPPDCERAIITKHVYRVTLDQALVVPALVQWSVLGSPAVRAQIYGEIRGQTRPGINGEILRQVAMPIPPLAEQTQIVAEIDRRLSVVDAVETEVDHALQRAARLRQAILRRAFEGRLVPQESDDQYHSVLLGEGRPVDDEGIKARKSARRKSVTA